MTESDTTGGSTLIFRQDRAGRVRRTAQQRAEILAEFDRSGLSGPQFARVAGISYQTLATWLKKRRESALVPTKSPNEAPGFFMQAVVGSSGGGEGLKLKFAGGATTIITTPQQARLAAALVSELGRGRSGC